MVRNKPKILFYGGTFFGFRSLPIWHVYEIAQKYSTILLMEKLDSETELVLKNKNFFPKLEKIVFTQNRCSSFKSMLISNRRNYKEAKDIISNFKPDIFISGGLVYPFPLYLRRFVERRGGLNICPFSPRISPSKEIRQWLILTSAYLRGSNLLPISIKIFFEKIKKNIGHFIYYWGLPLSVGEMPFRKEPGCILFKKITGRSADYYISFLKKDYQFALDDGMPLEKLYNLSRPYPLEYDKVRDYFKKRFILNNKNKLAGNKILTIMWPNSETGVNKKNLKLISKEKLDKQRIEIILLILKILKNWKIFIKPHPEHGKNNCLKIKKMVKAISCNIEVVDELDWADAYTELSDVILGLPPVSMSLYTASLICPEKPILSINFENELLGDGYKDFDGIEYIDNKEKLTEILELIRDNKYCKENKNQKQNILENNNFFSFLELLDCLYNKKIKD